MSVDNSIKGKSDFDIVQLCHGRVIPNYSSGYSLRCNELTDGLNRVMVSVFGPSLTSKRSSDAVQFRANLMLINAFIKGNRSFEILLSKGKYLPSRYLKTVDELISASKCVILEGPWHFRLVKDLIQGKPLIYDAHNFEAGLRKDNIHLEFVKKLEKEACDAADLVLTVTPEDKDSFVKEYAVSSEKIRLLTHVPVVNQCSWDGMKSRTLVFIGSLYEANIRAYREVEKLAEALPNFDFAVIGSICDMPGKKRIPNLRCLGIISEEEKDGIMASSMVALNPIVLGSGRNVKMVDYLAHSLPVLSTRLGVRGFDPEKAERACRVVELDAFSKQIEYLDKNRSLLQEMSEAGRNLYSKVKDENEITFKKIYNELLSQK